MNYQIINQYHYFITFYFLHIHGSLCQLTLTGKTLALPPVLLGGTVKWKFLSPASPDMSQREILRISLIISPGNSKGPEHITKNAGHEDGSDRTGSVRAFDYCRLLLPTELSGQNYMGPKIKLPKPFF